MQLKTILNRVQRHPGFVYGKCELVDRHGAPEVEVTIRPDRRQRGECSGCGHTRPGYDTLPARRFEFVPLWGMRVCFVYAMRRVNCAACGVVVEAVPWAEGKSHLTTAYASNSA
jgi:transposase